MKKLISALLILTLLCACFVSCKPEKEVDLAAVKTQIEGGDLFLDELVSLSESRIESVIGLDLTDVEHAEFYIGSGNTGEEYGLFACTTSEAALALVDQLVARRDNNYALYASYAVDALPRIENTSIYQTGRYVVYVSADKYEKAAELVEAALK